MTNRGAVARRGMRVLRPAALVFLALLFITNTAGAAVRKIGEMDLYLRGITAAVDPLAPVVPKNTPTGVRIVVRSGDSVLSVDEVSRFAGGAFRIEGDLAGPGLRVPVSLPFDGSASITDDPFLLAIPSLSVAGDYDLSNLRLTVGGRTVLDVAPRRIVVKVIDQILVTSVTTRPLTLAELKDRGVVIDSNSYLGFEFTVGVQVDSKAVDVSFPVVFDSRGVAIPQPLQPPPSSGRADVPLPTFVPMLLKPSDNGPAPVFHDAGGHDVEVRIPSVLVIPGNVGYLKQFFSAQLFVANGAPAGSGLTVDGVNATIVLPPGADRVAGTTDDPLSLPDKVSGPQPKTQPVAGAGPDGQGGTADDVRTFAPGEQGLTEFVIRGDQEGFHNLDFDIEATLKGLPTGAVKIGGKASGGVLVRNPYFDLSFSVPSVVRNGEQFKVYVTVNNISQAIANGVRLTLDGSRMSGAHLVSDPTQTIDTLASRDSRTVEYTFRGDRTGQVVATYLKFDTQNGTTGDLKFTLAVGERGVPLSPDTLVLPSAVDNLPATVVEAAMRVLGQGWSVANAPSGTLPANVTRTSKTVVTQKALALAEAGLRVGLGQPPLDAVRDLVFDFEGGTADAGFDQILRQTEAGRDFAKVAGNALRPAMQSAGTPGAYERATAQLAASGADFLTFSTGGDVPLGVTLTDSLGNAAKSDGTNGFTSDAVATATLLPFGTDAKQFLGLVANPSSIPYTVVFDANGSGSADFSFTIARGSNSFLRAFATGVTVVQGAKLRVVLDARRTLALEVDANGDGTYDSQQTLSTEILYPQGPTFVAAAVIGPETLAGASPFGFQAALLFDRVVDGASAADLTRYTIPANSVLSAKRQLSGRLVFVTLSQPEGPYLTSSIAAAPLKDLRGISGGAKTVSLQSRLRDIGAVVSGRIVDADGAGVSSANVTYAQNPILDCAPPLDDYAGLTNVTTDANGRYELRYVRQDSCGMPFEILTRDPSSGALRSVSSSVRVPGEQIVLDIALFGRGSVAGTVRDLANHAVSGAQVVAVSDTDPQVGGTATTDVSGRYRIDGITVGSVHVTAAKVASVGRGAGRIDRAGGTATIDLTLDGGAVAVAGTVRKIEEGVSTVVPGLQVVYWAKDGGSFVPVAVTQTSSTGAYAFNGMPVGEYRVEAALNTRDRGETSGVAAAGDHLTGRDVLITIASTGSGTVRGLVKLPDGSPAVDVIVVIDDRGVLTGLDGRFNLPGVAIRPNASRVVTARTRDGLRSGTNSVMVSDPNQIVENVTITLSGLGTAEFTVLDPAKNPVPNQEVALLGQCDNACGCATAKSGADGRVRFTGLPLGSVSARATLSGAGFYDQAQATVSVARDGVTAFGILQFGGAGTVTGTVLDPDGRPALGASVALQSKVFNDDNCSLESGVSHRAKTDSQGKFRFTNVNVGAIALTVTHPFFPAAAGRQATLAKAGDTLDFEFRLSNTTAGELSGTVFLPDGTTPAGAGVEVTANGALPDVTVTTDAAGKFRFAKIFPAGSYSVTARDPISGGLVRDQIYLQSAQDMQHDLRLKGRGQVQVRVVDGAGQPVANAFVRLTETDFPNRVYEGAVQPSNLGVVTFDDVFEGHLSAEASDVFARGGRTSSILPKPDASITMTVSLTVTGKVRGHFLRPDRTTSIAFGSVRLVAGGRVIGQTTTDASGSFAFDYVPAGAVRLEAQDPLTARTGIAAGSIATEGEELQLDVVAQGIGNVQGLVTSNGAAQPGAQVVLNAGNLHASTLADATGHYRFDGVPEGLVSVTASLDGSFLSGTNSATLTGEAVTITLDVAMRGSARVTAHVVASDGTTPATIAVVSAQSGGTGGGTQSGSVDETGTVVFDRVPAGLAAFSAEVPGAIDRGRVQADVAAGVMSDVTIRLNGVGAISGRTIDSSGQPAAGDLTINGSGAFPYTIALRTGTDGNFTIREALAGSYTATLRSQSGEFTLYGTTTGSIAPGVTNNVTVQLQPSGTVTGVVLRANGTTPAYGATVLLQLDPNRGSVSLQAGSDGRFTARGVPLGAFTIRVDDALTGGIAIVRGLTVANNGDTIDAGNIVLDDSPVAVLSVDPADGATGVEVNHPIVLTFSDPLQSAAGISVANGTTNVSMNAVLSADAKIVTLTGALPDGAQVTVVAGTALTDFYGRHPAQAFTSRFRTVDHTPPAVATVVPANGAIEVAPAASITVTFSEPLSPTTNAANLITVTGANNIVAPGTTVAVSPAVYTFTPAAPLAANSIYSVMVNSAIDLSANVQTVAFGSTFATTDTAPPSISLNQPRTPWTSNGKPFIEFLTQDTVSGIAAGSGTMTIDGTPVAAVSSTSTVSFTPATLLNEGSHTVVATVKDRAGNAATATATFGTDTTPPSVPVLTGIAEGQTLHGIVTIAATGVDAGAGVAQIQVLYDNAVFLTLTAPSFTAQYDTAALPEGPHAFTARSVDVAGNSSAISAAINAIVDNRPLSVNISAPAAQQRFRDSVAVQASATEPVARIEFTLGTQTVSDASQPYAATFDVGAVADGPQTITVKAYGLSADVATATVAIVVDHTPPAAPDATKINAEPPVDGRSLVFARAGGVEGNATVDIRNTASNATARIAAAADGSFSVYIAAAVDDLLSLTATDTVGNTGPATMLAVRRVPSLPPATGATTLRFEGVLVDKVGAGSGIAGMTKDGVDDAVFTLSMQTGDGVTRQLQYIDLAGPSMRSTRPGNLVLGVAVDAGAALLNAPDGQLTMPVTNGTTLSLFAATANNYIQGGATYTVTAIFTDGSRFIATTLIPAEYDKPRVAHSATVTSSSSTIAVGSTPATTTITLSDLRDIDGTLVPDGAKVALTAANAATKNGFGIAIGSAGGVIVDGTVAANNPAFRVFPMVNGRVTATYSSDQVVPVVLSGALAVVQVIAADDANNVIGSEAIGSIDLNLKVAADRATMTSTPTTLYGDKNDRRSHLVIKVRDANGNPAADGTKVLVGANTCFSRWPSNGFCIDSFGGAILGGTNNRIFTVANGVVEADYSANNLIVGSGGVSSAVIQVLPADANGNATTDRAIGLHWLQIVGASSTEIEIAPDTLPYTDPVGRPAQFRVHHLHDSRGNLAPADAKVLVSAISCASRWPSNGFCVDSAGGTIVDGAATPAGSSYKMFDFTDGSSQGTYSTQGVGAIGTGGQVTSTLQVLMADKAGFLASDRTLGYTSIRIVGALNALGSVSPTVLFGDGALQTATVTFDHILDVNGNPLPDGTKVLATAASCGGRFQSNGFCVDSAGGQILNGDPSPSGSFYKVFPITGGKVTITYGNQGIAVPPSGTVTPTVMILPASAVGALLSDRVLGYVSLTIVGTTSGSGAVTPSTLHADGSDFRSTVTFSNFTDGKGRPVPDGTKVALSATSCAARFPSNGFCVDSAGGAILGGDPAPFGSFYRIFTIANGQVVATYSSNTIVSTSERFATVMALSVNQSNQLLSDRALATVSIRLVAPNSATVSVSPAGMSSTGVNQFSDITVSDLKDVDPNLPVPDGSKVGLSVISCASRFQSNGFCIDSVGGLITPVGTMPGDGDPAPGNANFKLFTVRGGQVKATYSSNGIFGGINETRIATVQVVPANSSGQFITDRSIGTATIRLYGTTSTTAAGPATVPRNGGTATVVFSGIKDTAGNQVPDGTLVVAALGFCNTRYSENGFCVDSAGGTITNGTASPTNGFKVFTVTNGSVSVDYSTVNAAANSPAARIQLAPASPAGAIYGDRSLFGGVFTINLN
jgi:hypothetical protein